MSESCRATFDLANGEYVSPCHLEKGHEGDHRGHVLGSPCSWPQGFESEEEMYFARLAEDTDELGTEAKADPFGDMGSEDMHESFEREVQ